MITTRASRPAVLLCLLALAAVVAVAQPPAPDYTDETRLPDGRRGERIRQVLEAVNSGDAGRVDALVKDAFAGRLRELPIEEHRSELLGLYDRSQGLDFYGIRRYVPPRPADLVVVIARNRLTDGWHGLSLTFDGSPEERITGLEVQPARPPKDAPTGAPVSLDQAMDELRTFVDRLAAAEAFSGTVLVARDGRPVFTAAHGLADRNHAVPMRLDTKLNLGSMDKMFTAVAVGQLVDEGRLSFDDPVSKYLDASWTKADLSKVRVKHLLSHTSGLGSYFNDTYERTARQLLRNVGDYKPLVAGERLEFEPGTQSRYSNTGFLLAGAVLEAATGRDYFDVVRERVYARAGMMNSDSYDIDLVVPNLGIGYSRERTSGGGRTWRANTFAHVIRGGPAGGGYSTVEDLLAFAEAMRNGRLVSEATRETLWSPKPELSSPTYGYGFGTWRHALGRVVGHGGGFSGISSGLDIYRDAGWTVVVLSNVDGGAQPVQQKAAELLARVH
jgi:CubicO group peptidase (beta-lactamase class C family)